MANAVLVEGLALDLAQMNGPSFVPPVDATQEFRVQTNNFSAEFGRSAGAVVNFSIKSGTNQLHGSAYEFLRNKVLNANNFFQNRAGNARPAFIQNQFGGSAGGPIISRKTRPSFSPTGKSIATARSLPASLPFPRRCSVPATFRRPAMRLETWSRSPTRLQHVNWRTALTHGTSFLAMSFPLRALTSWPPMLPRSGQHPMRKAT